MTRHNSSRFDNDYPKTFMQVDDTGTIRRYPLTVEGLQEAAERGADRKVQLNLGYIGIIGNKHTTTSEGLQAKQPDDATQWVNQQIEPRFIHTPKKATKNSSSE